jgi:two-component system response regulator NreC
VPLADSPSEPIRVLLADDHAMLRDGLAALIDAQADMAVVGHAGGATVAVERTRSLKPDVVVLDMMMPGGGLSALTAIRADCPNTRVLVLSVLDDLEHVSAAMASGAQGYLAKRASSGELLEAIRGAQRGEQGIGLSVEALAELAKRSPEKPPPTASLTDRECEVLRLLACGHTHREIAERLQLSKKTVDAYRTRLYERLGVRGRAELVRHAIAAGLFGVPSTRA